MNPHNILILGAGYAGVMAANQLAADHNVTIVNARPHFVERIRLHQFVIGGHTAERPLADVLSPKVRVVVGKATQIDAASRQVAMDDGETLPYDYLVYAVGSRAAKFSVIGAEFAYDIAEWESAHALRDALNDAPASVTMIGGGLTGVETAAELAESKPGTRVSLITANVVVPGFSTRGRRAVRRTLDRLGVTVYENTAVQRITRGEVVTASGVIPSDVTIMATGMRAGSLASDSGLTTDSLGRLVTDHALRCIDDARIVAAGDSAAPPAEVAGHVRMSCAAGLPLGALAARTVASLSDGREPAPISLGFIIQCMSLGRRGGVVQHVARNDAPRNVTLAGRPGAFVKEQICRSTITWLAREIEKPGSYKWPSGPRVTVDTPGKVYAK